jgi:hypothetical protein
VSTQLSERRGRRRIPHAVAAVVVLVVVIAVASGTGSHRASGTAWTCVTTNGVTEEQAWSRMLGRQFIDADPTWEAWDHPWILNDRRNAPQYDWTDWLAADRAHRFLVLTIGLIPSDLQGEDWLGAGATGAYDQYARVLARNLIAAGMGAVTIRLGHEANGTWYPDSIPDTSFGDLLWVQFWRNTVNAMRSVPGAHFRFDWTVNAGYRRIPLNAFYPGNQYVDVIGVDAYDTDADSYTGPRLTAVLHQPDGLLAVRAFARAHHKPLSVPEWGIGPAAPPGQPGTGGSDPAYINALARIFRSGGVLYQGYFPAGVYGRELIDSPASLSAYRRQFGRGGNDAP